MSESTEDRLALIQQEAEFHLEFERLRSEFSKLGYTLEQPSINSSGRQIFRVMRHGRWIATAHDLQRLAKYLWEVA